MNKKLALKIGIPVTVVTATIIGLAVPIATKDHDQAWKVSLTGSGMYGTDVYDAAQSKSKSSTDAEKAFIWGIKDEADQKAAVAAKWGITANDVLPLLKKDNDKGYANGLQKLAYEMMHPSQENGTAATLVYGDGSTTVAKAGLSAQHVYEAIKYGLLTKYSFAEGSVDVKAAKATFDSATTDAAKATAKKALDAAIKVDKDAFDKAVGDNADLAKFTAVSALKPGSFKIEAVETFIYDATTHTIIKLTDDILKAEVVKAAKLLNPTATVTIS